MRSRRVRGCWRSQNRLPVTSIRSSLGDSGEGMRNRYIVFVVIAVLSIVFVGCTRNPETAKRKYVESGMKYMEQKKYDSALIQFKKALQVDPRYAEAHYELGMAEMDRSEEHTSELQSPCNLVCRLLLEKN